MPTYAVRVTVVADHPWSEHELAKLTLIALASSPPRPQIDVDDFDPESVRLLMDVNASRPSEAETLATLRASRLLSRFDTSFEVVLATVLDP